MTQCHCKIVNDDDGTVYAIAEDKSLTLTILPDGHAKAFNRNFKTTTTSVNGSKDSGHERWLVGELNGVRVYINGGNIIMTTRDMYK